MKNHTWLWFALACIAALSLFVIATTESIQLMIK